MIDRPQESERAIDFFLAPAAAFRVLYILLASVPMIVDVAQKPGDVINHPARWE